MFDFVVVILGGQELRFQHRLNQTMSAIRLCSSGILPEMQQLKGNLPDLMLCWKTCKRHFFCKSWWLTCFTCLWFVHVMFCSMGNMGTMRRSIKTVVEQGKPAKHALALYSHHASTTSVSDGSSFSHCRQGSLSSAFQHRFFCVIIIIVIIMVMIVLILFYYFSR